MEPAPDPGTFRVEPMTEATARVIADWQSPGQYGLFDPLSGTVTREDFLDPSRWPDRLFAVRDDGGLVGFYEFTTEGDTLVLALGMAPARARQDDDERFVRRALAFAREQYDAHQVVVAVPAVDQHAVTTVRNCGFSEQHTETRTVDGAQTQHLVFSRPLGLVD